MGYRYRRRYATKQRTARDSGSVVPFARRRTMILGSKSHIPWFELSILLVLMAMGWILYDLNHISRRQSQFEQQFQSELAEQQKAVETYFRGRVANLESRWDSDVLNWSNVFKGLVETQMAYKLH